MTHSHRSHAGVRLSALALAGWLAGSVLACSGPQGPEGPTGPQGSPGKDGVPTPVRLLDDKVGRWLPENRTRLNEMISSLGIASPAFDPKNRPVAVFDWDNTVVKNDLGDATFFWMLRHDKVLQPMDRDWSTTSRHLTPEGRAALNTACDAAAAPGEPLQTSTHTDCADELVSIYDSGKTRAGQSAWNNRITLTLNTSYAWVAQLQAGYTPEELRAFARSAYAENAFNPPGTTQTVGTTSGLAFHVQAYEEMVDLIETLQANGFDVWVVTASPQFVIDAVSEELVGIKPNRVIGIRTVTDARGRVTPHLQGCGTVADGADTLITYDQGKRCWINKVIFHQSAEQQLTRVADERMRQVFAAGDSDTDLSFVQDATHLKLAINRNKVQLMCNAYANRQGRWLVQPMFIQPRAKGASYPCTTALDAAGQPITDEEGNRFTQDYEDRVYALP
ncbi:haloacid dehalogenase-like hydrolase [Vitiosangium sp. GDMCC 1.1324]|uniref:haloacid dehalogenase-like hydrolase n=1 Tax=Vitiosangium sp. (strain GDMCC 1.1324) TaxID=2138576 RepID=UPI001E506F8D|nr:haloacid dehalogenase-like hydrolase [Vitiosangium sp. GDMCC 1.1324]